eukprot:COSAG02_NODE_50_length_44860_cov_203.992739_42_plen_107_part_00
MLHAGEPVVSSLCSRAAAAVRVVAPQRGWCYAQGGACLAKSHRRGRDRSTPAMVVACVGVVLLTPLLLLFIVVHAAEERMDRQDAVDLTLDGAAGTVRPAHKLIRE